ncbi:site-2 protease family protein [Candidatus Uhrbacteria bacterium]|nr:site-2 protease family protein [Candidatus Uhrbacteria bacterium]
MLAIITFILVLGLLVFVHEAGHFIVAKRAGMGVEEFGFGFPPRIVGFQKRAGRWRIVWGNSPSPSRSPSQGEGEKNNFPTSRREGGRGGVGTVYSMNWVPLGGFVRITGENGADTDDPKNFAAKPKWQRAIVLVAGVAMNLVLAVALFSLVYTIGAPQVLEGLPSGAVVRNVKTSIVGVLASGPAATVGIVPGDSITAVDGRAFAALTDVQQYIRERGGQELQVTVDRNGTAQTFAIRPGPLPGVEHPGIGVQLVATGTVRFPLHVAVWYGVRTTGVVIVDILRALGNLVHGLATQRAVTVDIAGPVGIAVMTGQVVQLGFIHLLQFTAVLSANLALLNIFPFPALDGGRLFLLAIEAFRRRALTKRVENLIHTIGFAVLLLLVVAVTYRDLTVFGGSIVSSIRGAVGF